VHKKYVKNGASGSCACVDGSRGGNSGVPDGNDSCGCPDFSSLVGTSCTCNASDSGAEWSGSNCVCGTGKSWDDNSTKSACVRSTESFEPPACNACHASMQGVNAAGTKLSENPADMDLDSCVCLSDLATVSAAKNTCECPKDSN